MHAFDHYVRVSLPKLHGRPRGEFSRDLARITTALHHDRTDERPYPIGLPADRTGASDLGDCLIVYGTHEHLVDLMIQSRLRAAMDDLGLAMSTLIPVPADAPPVVFRRDRDDKVHVSDAYVERRLRRARRRIEEGKTRMTADDLGDMELAIRTRRGVSTNAFVPLSSKKRKSNAVDGMQIPREEVVRRGVLRIGQASAAEGRLGRFTTYGLSSDGATVPLVS